MKLSSPLFIVLSSVSGTVLIAAEPCDISRPAIPGSQLLYGFGTYDMTACNACAENGNGQTGHSVCCNAIYRHSFGRDDDDFVDHDESLSPPNCVGIGGTCTVSNGACIPGLTCVSGKCQLQTDNPEAHAAATALVTNSSSTDTITKGGPSFVLVVVGLLGAAMMMLKVVKRRHRGLLRRNQYREVDATRIDV